MMHHYKLVYHLLTFLLFGASMAYTLNKVMLIGNLGKDPEIRHTQAGKMIANFSIATSERWKDAQGQKQERTSWHNIVVFNPGLAGICQQYLSKGHKIFVEGKLQTRKWTDKQGQDRYTTEIVLSGFDGQIIMLSPHVGVAPASQQKVYVVPHSSPNPSPGHKSGVAVPSAQDSLDADDFEDDIPF